jgi:hypothetical protein
LKKIQLAEITMNIFRPEIGLEELKGGNINRIPNIAIPNFICYYKNSELPPVSGPACEDGLLPRLSSGSLFLRYFK